MARHGSCGKTPWLPYPESGGRPHARGHVGGLSYSPLDPGDAAAGTASLVRNREVAHPGFGLLDLVQCGNGKVFGRYP